MLGIRENADILEDKSLTRPVPAQSRATIQAKGANVVGRTVAQLQRQLNEVSVDNLWAPRLVIFPCQCGSRTC